MNAALRSLWWQWRVEVLMAAGLVLLSLVVAGADLLLRPLDPMVLERLFPDRSFATMSPAQVAEVAYDGQTLLVDARSPAEYRRGHIAGAVLLPPGPSAVQWARFYDYVHPDLVRIVVYCGEPRCDAAVRTMQLLRQDAALADLLVYVPAAWPALMAEPGLSVVEGMQP